jgi:hypothetical protein
MRVRITHPLSGSIDGIQLSHLMPGQVYEVGTQLACYLLSSRMAEPVTDYVPVNPLASVADDREPRKKSGNRKGRRSDRPDEK